jgi:hypothetical protein
MAGSRTRFGFAGGGGPNGTPDPRSSRTILGHDAHLLRTELPPAEPRPATQELPPTAVVPPTEEPPAAAPPPARVPSHSGKSNYPTVARLFGRWNDDGKLVAHDHPEPAVPDWVVTDDELLEPPRERAIPRWALVAVAIAVCVLAAALLLRHRSHPPPAAPPTAVETRPAERITAAPRPELPPSRLASVPARPTPRPAPRRRPPRADRLSDDALPPRF